MKPILTFVTVLLFLTPKNSFAQSDLEVEGTVTIGTMGKDNQSENVVVKTTSGLLAVRDVSSLGYGPWHLGQDTLGGIVYHLHRDSDGTIHGLLVSTTESSEKWQNTPSKTNGELTYDGQSNTDLLSDSPAKDWINANFPADYYLPSIDELSLLWQQRFFINKALDDGGYNSLKTDFYWSSTEKSTLFAWLFDFATGMADYTPASKTSAEQVRAVRKF